MKPRLLTEIGMKNPKRIVAVVLALLAIADTAPAGPLNDRPATDDIFYMYMPIAWRDADNDTYRFGDFQGMIDALPYLEDLGITAVWFNPIFPSPAYHGYQHGPSDEINGWFGTEADFLTFIAAAHARGIKVFVDNVVYGISHDSIWYQDAFGNPNSPYDEYLAFTNGANTSYVGYTFTTWNGDQVGFIHWNLNNAAVTELITGWAEHWLDPNNDGNFLDGIDGYRLDHVSAFHPDESPWGYDLAWWIGWHNRLRALNPDVFTFAEQADWGSHGTDLLPAFDAAMTKPFLFAARNALASEQAAGLYAEMQSTIATLNGQPPEKFYLATLGDHDVDRLTSVIGGDLQKARTAAAVLMTQPFPPVIYYGDEIGMLGVKANYGSDANDIPMREPFKWNAVAGPPMSNYFIINNQAYNNRYSQDNDGRSVEEQQGVNGSLLETYRSLITARKQHSALRYGSYHALTNNNDHVWTFLRHDAGNETLLVAINLSGSQVGIQVDLAAATIPGGSTSVVDIITGQPLPDLTDANKAAYPMAFAPYTFRVAALNVIPGKGPPPTNIDGHDVPQDIGDRHLVALQNNHTSFGDNVTEADALYVRPAPGGLRVGVTGNVQTNGSGFVLLFDTVPGGQLQLITAGFPTPPAAIPNLDGTIMDIGFEPDVMLFVNAFNSQFYIDRYTLPTGTLGEKRFVGFGTIGSGDETIGGGANPFGMKMALDNTNTAGVTNTDPTGAETATTGLEGFVPLEDLMLDPSADQACVSVMMVYPTGEVGNQVLPGLGGGYDDLGFAPDLINVAGDQHAEVSLHLFADFDNDKDVDLSDTRELPACMTGPFAAGLPDTSCAAFDDNGDTDVDLADAAGIQNVFVEY